MKTYLGHIFATLSILVMAFITVILFLVLLATGMSFLDILFEYKWKSAFVSLMMFAIAIAMNIIWYSTGRNKWMEWNKAIQKMLFGKVY